MSTKEVKCPHCRNVQKIVFPVRHDPICRQCRKPIPERNKIARTPK
jgi:phage FluMu protein Com